MIVSLSGTPFLSIDEDTNHLERKPDHTSSKNFPSETPPTLPIACFLPSDEVKDDSESFWWDCNNDAPFDT